MVGSYRLREDQSKKEGAGAGPTAKGGPPGGPSAPGTPAATPTAGERSLLAERAKAKAAPPARLVSLDAYRGFIMFVLAASGFGIAQFARVDAESPVWEKSDRDKWQRIAFHFDHPAWQSNFLPSFLEKPEVPDYEPSGFLKFGVSFWDLIQPAFMFMVGVAMPFSYARREATGHSALRRFLHAVWRAKVLVLMGVFLYSLKSERTNWIFPNVLAQIGLGYLFAYLLLGRKLWMQLTALGVILVGYWLAFFVHTPPTDYDYVAVNNYATVAEGVEKGQIYEGKFAAWSKNANAAHWFDRRFLNLLRTVSDEDKEKYHIRADATSWSPEFLCQWLFANSEPFVRNNGGYQTLNFIPSIGTTILGILCGQLLLSSLGKWKKLGIFLVGGLLCMALGLVAGEFACPIVKRIWTPSWVLFSGAYVIWMLALFYFLFDVLPFKFMACPLVVVGMNSIAIYMMGELIRGWTINKVIRIHLTGFLESAFGSDALKDDMYGHLIFSTAAAIVFWLIAYWMYRQKYFIRV